jgi:pimeloyl-ACP methyl ester carboxylesterase
MLSNAVNGLRILYTSTDGIEGATSIAVSGTVYFPKGSPPSGGWPIAAWAHGFVGISDICAPSWRRRTKRDIDYLNAWLAEGFAIVATDYQGMGTPGGHAWGVPIMEAHGVIDSVRAARRAFRDLSNQVVLVGQSQGARAVLSASALAPTYAPEFAFKATVATGVPGGPPHAPHTKAPQIPVPTRTGGGVHARLAVYTIFRLLALNRDFDPSEYLSDEAKPSFEAARTGCLVDVDEVNAKNGVTVDNTFHKLPEAAMRKAAQYQVYPRPKFARPVFMGVGLADTTTFPEGQYNLAAAACYEGSTVEIHYYSGLDHSGAVNPSLVDSLPFVRKAVAGEAIPGNCATLKPPRLAR